MAKESVKSRALLLFALALAARAALLLLAGRGVGIEPGTDAVSYDRFARLMLAGPGWVAAPLAEREPLYPAFMALAYLLPGPDVPWLQALQAILGASTCSLLYLGGRAMIGEGGAIIAALLLGFNPHYLFYAAFPLRENLVVALLVASFLSLAWACRRAGRGPLLLAALAYASLIHTDVRFLPLALCLPLVVLFLDRSGQVVGRSLLYALFLLVLLIPYQVRSSLALGKPVVVTERFMGQWLPLVGKRYRECEDKESWLASWQKRKMNSATLSPRERALLLSGSRPALNRWGIYRYHFLEYWRFLRLSSSYRPYPDGRFEPPWSLRHNLASSIALLPFFFLIPFALGSRRHRRVVSAVLAFVAAHMVLHVLVHARERYRIPVEGLLGIVTAVGAVELFRRWPVQRRLEK